jgi:2-polyprenyl-3-methyl-5-hydroxy-6-metoxy-1,4-benzoquinol methylase
MDTEGLAAEGQQFDVVSSLEVIEHVNNPELFINSLSSLVKVPSTWPFIRELELYWGGSVFAHGNPFSPVHSPAAACFCLPSTER